MAKSDNGDSDIGLDEVKVGIIANFTTDVTSGTAPLTIQFTDQSAGSPASWEWDFNNDGVVDSHIQNPSFTFNTGGCYTVKLIVSRPGITDTLVKTNLIKAISYATLPFTETFDNLWINYYNTRDIPSQYWTNTPATGDNSWSRNDDGITRGAWAANKGLYTPEGANGSNYSARIHTYNTNQSGTLDLNINFSTGLGNTALSFWYNNADGEDSLKVYLSTDGGSNFGSPLKILTTSVDWTKIIIDLGNVTTTKGVIRFLAKGDKGLSDIGLDEVRVGGLSSYFSADVIYGTTPLTVKFTDQSFGNPTSWKWDFNNDGIIDATTQNPTYTYTSGGNYTVKFWALSAESSDSIIKVNCIKVNTYASFPFSEGFENTWVKRASTRDVPSLNWDNLPAMGNNSWSCDDDGLNRGAWTNDKGFYTTSGANGTNHSARFHSYEAKSGEFGILDLYINFSNAPAKDTLSFYYINTDGTDSLEVFLSTNQGLDFTKIGAQKVQTNWTKIKINLGNITTATGVVRFKAWADNQMTDIGIDEIKIGQSNLTDITEFIVPSQIGTSVINTTNHTISVKVPSDFNLAGEVVATFALPSGANAKVGTTNQISGTTPNNFSSAVTYMVTSQDETVIQPWTITLVVAKNNQANITAFSVPGQTGNSIIDATNFTIAVKVPSDFNLTGVVATFTLSGGATVKVGNLAQVSGATSNNFTNPLIYAITAEDGTTQNWTVTITKSSGVAEIESENITVYPNPSAGLFHVKLNASDRVQLEVYNFAGSKTLDQFVDIKGEQIVPVDLTGYPAGIYILQILLKEKAVRVKLVVK